MNTELCCGNCLVQYDQQRHLPQLLPCRHTLCAGCVSELYAADSRRYLCPICRERISWSKRGISHLPTDHAVLRILQLSRTMSDFMLREDGVEGGRKERMDELCVFCWSRWGVQGMAQGQ